MSRAGAWHVDDPDDDDAAAAQEAGEFLEEIEELQNDDRYHFASDTLDGIHESVEAKGYVTEGQRRAIANIRKSVEDR